MDLYLVLVALIGLLIGSFLNVCIYRIPVTHQLFEEDLYPGLVKAREKFSEKFSVSFPPRSVCPKCFHELNWYHNIPVVSWIFLGGKCAFCKTKISIRYPLVELFSSISAVASVILYGYTFTALFCFLLFATFIVIALIDYDHFMIPDAITYPMTLIGIVSSVVNEYQHFLNFPFNRSIFGLLIGLIGGAGFLYIVSKLYLILRKREGLGFGDVKLLALVGAFMGLEASFFTIFMGSILGTFGAIFLLTFSSKSNMNQPIPFGPYLVSAAALYLVLSGLGISFY